MYNDVKSYMKEFENNLKGIPKAEKEDIIMEIQNHIQESRMKQESVEGILNKLGNPKKLAHAYASEYYIDNHAARTPLLPGAIFYSFTGLTGMFVLPTLSILAFSLILCGVIVACVPFINLLGFVRIPFSFIVPLAVGAPQIICGIIAGALFLMAGLGCFKALQLYCKAIASAYRRLRMK